MYYMDPFLGCIKNYQHEASSEPYVISNESLALNISDNLVGFLMKDFLISILIRFIRAFLACVDNEQSSLVGDTIGDT